VNFEGGQMPIHMRLGKLRGPTKKMSMPFEPFRTHTQPVNLSDLEDRFEAGAEVTLDAMREKGLAKRKGIPVKVSARVSSPRASPSTPTASRPPLASASRPPAGPPSSSPTRLGGQPC
jgi:ribosomal protein L15